MDEFVKVAKITDLSEEEIMLVEVGDERIVLSNIGGSFYAIGEVCPHAEGPLSDRRDEDGRLALIVAESQTRGGACQVHDAGSGGNYFQ